ncbi:hypothetical protein ACQY0O_005477 [Thecaphora frezii]
MGHDDHLTDCYVNRRPSGVSDQAALLASRATSGAVTPASRLEEADIEHNAGLETATGAAADAVAHQAPATFSEKPAAAAESDPFLVTFVPNDSLKPTNWSFLKRCIVIALISTNAFIVSCFASAYLFVAPIVALEWGLARHIAILPFVMYVMMWGLGPMILAPLSDSYGRKPVYIGSVILWTVFHIGAAVSNNIAALTMTRLLAGFFGPAALTNGGGSIVDMFEGVGLARSTALYSLFVFLGPVLGPIVGGFIAEYVEPLTDTYGGWRWVFWVAVISGTVSTVVHCLLPETHGPTILKAKVQRLNRRAEKEGKPASYFADPKLMSMANLPVTTKMLMISFMAFKMLVTEPIIVVISIWQISVLSIVYLFFEAFPVVFGEEHGFNTAQVGLAFIGIGVGMSSNALYYGTVDVYFYVRKVMRNKGQRVPEMRMPFAFCNAVLVVVGLFWFAYTSYPSVHFMAAIVGSAVFGFGVQGVMLSTFSMTVETYHKYSACAFAAQGFARCVVTSVFPLFGTEFYENLGPRQATLIMACICLLECLIPLVALKYGKRIRLASKLASHL